MELPQRKRIRLPWQTYETAGETFLFTVCTHDKRRLFETGPLADWVFQTLIDGPMRDEADVWATCLMPDHVHLLWSPKAENLVDIVGRWKSFVNTELCRRGVRKKVWQRSFHDRGIRGRTPEDVARYVVDNPVRQGLVERWEDWPYSWHAWI